MDETMKMDLLDQAQPVAEMPPIPEAPPVEAEKKPRDAISARIGPDLYDWMDRFCEEQGLRQREFVTAAIMREKAYQEGQRQANEAGGLAFTGRRFHLVKMGKAVYVAETAALAAEMASHLNRMTDGRWKRVEKLKEWKATSLRDAKILPPGPRETVEARIESEFNGFMADLDREMPVDPTAQATVFEADEVSAVVDRALEKE